MAQKDAKQIALEIASDVVSLGITKQNHERIAIAKLIARKLKEATNDEVYVHVIHRLNAFATGDILHL